jgi:hypothetical protein
MTESSKVTRATVPIGSLPIEVHRQILALASIKRQKSGICVTTFPDMPLAIF